jgi:hypothetical protein
LGASHCGTSSRAGEGMIADESKSLAADLRARAADSRAPIVEQLGRRARFAAIEPLVGLLIDEHELLLAGNELPVVSQ